MISPLHKAVAPTTVKPHHQSWPKPEPRKRVKARKDRAESLVKRFVRHECVSRDEYCRYDVHGYDVFVNDAVNCEPRSCRGPLEWAHMHVKRRSQTRGQAAEIRHTTADSLMLCKLHHDQYDGRTRPRLLITKLTRNGADGPLKFTRAKA